MLKFKVQLQKKMKQEKHFWHRKANHHRQLMHVIRLENMSDSSSLEVDQEKMVKDKSNKNKRKGQMEQQKEKRERTDALVLAEGAREIYPAIVVLHMIQRMSIWLVQG